MEDHEKWKTERFGGNEDLTQYILRIARNNGWDTESGVWKNDAYLHGIIDKEDHPRIGFISFHTDAASPGGQFAERFTWLLDASREFDSIDVFAMVMYSTNERFRDSMVPAEHIKYFLSWFGFAYMDPGRTTDDEFFLVADSPTHIDIQSGWFEKEKILNATDRGQERREKLCEDNSKFNLSS